MTAAPNSTMVERVAAEIEKLGVSAPDAADFAEVAVVACYAEELASAVRANDALIRAIRHRDARWHDDELVKRLLERNDALLAKLDGQP